MPAMTQAEFARRKGVTQSAISQAVKADRIRLNDDGLIEVEAADEFYSQGRVNGQLAKAKTVRETYLAKKAKLDYEKSVGLLLDAEDVKRAMETLGEMLVRDIDQLQGYSDELVSIGAKDGTKGMRVRLKEISREIRRTITDNLKLDATDEGEWKTEKGATK